jgi:glycosyltransferase involved in cell wall biosynthesis
MKIAICSTIVPFIYGGGRNIVEWLALKLREYGHTVEIVNLPQIDDPKILIHQIIGYRFIDLSAADRVICIRPHSYFIPHPNKIIWFIHHFRIFYDLWETVPPSEQEALKGFRDCLFKLDTNAFNEARKIFTNSEVTLNRLKKFNGVENAKVLYPPLIDGGNFQNLSSNDEILCISRVEPHKRQELLIKSLAKTKTPVKLKFIGEASNPDYAQHLRALINSEGLVKRVDFSNCWSSEQEKVDALAHCLATAYLPIDEDSYGYPTLESCYSSKPILTTTDSGGVLELVKSGINGVIANPDPNAIAIQMDHLYLDRNRTSLLGRNALATPSQFNISWDTVVRELTS